MRYFFEGIFFPLLIKRALDRLTVAYQYPPTPSRPILLPITQLQREREREVNRFLFIIFTHIQCPISWDDVVFPS